MIIPIGSVKDELKRKVFCAQNQISLLSKYSVNCIKTFNVLIFLIA